MGVGERVWVGVVGSGWEWAGLGRSEWVGLGVCDITRGCTQNNRFGSDSHSLSLHCLFRNKIRIFWSCMYINDCIGH